MADILPLKLRVAIRDQYDPPTSRVQSSRARLEDALGVPYTINVLWKGLIDLFHPSGATSNLDILCTKVIDLLIHLNTQLYERVDDPDWGYAFLERLPTKRLDLTVIAHERKTSLTWNTSSPGTLQLALADPVSDLSALSVISTAIPTLVSAAPGPGGDFEHIPPALPALGLAPATPAPALSTPSPLGPERLPTLSSLPPPSTLLSTRPPYILYVTLTSSRITINGSHEPSLRLLSEYLNRWVRLNPNDVRNPPMLRVELREGWLKDGHRDVLVIEPWDRQWEMWVDMRPAVVLGFVEGVLGYVVEGGGGGLGGAWVYRRERAFV